MVAGGNGIPVPAMTNLLFPGWIEWPDPREWIVSQTNQIHVVGETFTLADSYEGDNDLGMPTWQWRKNGVPMGSAQPFNPSITGLYPGLIGGHTTLTITNAQPADAGIYDVDVRGNNWLIGLKFSISIQTTNGQGVFQKPQFLGTNFVCDLVGAATRNYKVQWSTNLFTWNDLVTLSNTTGKVTFTNSLSASGGQFYRTVLLP